MQALKDLNPSFLRFPGGNNLEGNDPPYRWIWNETIGPLTDRPGRPGTWYVLNFPSSVFSSENSKNFLLNGADLV